jgi:hypothetical protein
VWVFLPANIALSAALVRALGSKSAVFGLPVNYLILLSFVRNGRPLAPLSAAPSLAIFGRHASRLSSEPSGALTVYAH